MKKPLIYFLLYCLLFPSFLLGQEKIIPIAFGGFEQWITRNIKESKALGGNVMQVYAVGPKQTIEGDIPYENKGVSPWGSSNVMAVMMGITKTSNTVFPEKRDNDYCAKLETKLVNCKVLGMIDISVVVSGSLFFGRVIEPIKSANNPYNKIDMGIPFTESPKAIELDYKVYVRKDGVVTKSTIFSTQEYKGEDRADVFVFLQQRWEDKRGNIYARRIGTAREQFGVSSDGWVDKHRISIYYGDITQASFFRSYMELQSGFCAQNSKGKVVPVQEIGWGASSDTPTHMVFMISSGSLGAYVGALGNCFWVDNVKLVY